MIVILLFLLLYSIAGVLVGYMIHQSRLFMLKYNKMKSDTETAKALCELGHYAAVTIGAVLWPIVLLVEAVNVGK